MSISVKSPDDFHLWVLLQGMKRRKGETKEAFEERKDAVFFHEKEKVRLKNRIESWESDYGKEWS